MLISKEVEVSWSYKSREHYERLGYVYTKQRDKFIVPIEHLHKGSGSLIEIQCDYCGKIFTRRYADHTYITNKEVVNKDACKDCGKNKSKDGLIEKYGVSSPFESEEIRNKAKETFIERYGVDNPFEIPEVIEQIKQTNLEKYGFEYYTQTDEYKERVVETNMQKYGVDNPSKSQEIIDKIKDVQIERYGMFYSQTDEFKDKFKQTSMDKYGVENPFQAEEIKDKIIKHNLSIYGVTHPMKIEKIAQKRFKKMVATKYRNGNGISSRQQDYIAQILQGNVNYPYDGLLLDIRLNNNTYIEYDGSGHNLRVQFGEMTQEEFDIKEQRRKYFLISNKWREIRIISNKDLLPSEKTIRSMIREATEYLDSGHSWITYNIDNNKVMCSQYEKHYDFGELRKITEFDLNENTK